jgi:hypothetical protein
MNESIPLDVKQEFSAFCGETMRRLSHNTAKYSELLALWQELHDAYLKVAATTLQQWAETYDQSNETKLVLNKIEADVITVEVIDQNNGKMFRRNFPIKYVETANGVILSGETLEGKPSQLVLLSEFACTKIDDVTGRGADSPRDHDHSA